MTNIKPVVATMRKFTAGKLVKSLKSRNIAYERLSLDNEIIIRHNSKNGNSKYTYSFSKEEARILSKERQTPDSYYKTAWSDDKVTFKMINNDGSRHIKRSLTSSPIASMYIVKRLSKISDTEMSFLISIYVEYSSSSSVSREKCFFIPASKLRNGAVKSSSICEFM